MARQMIAKYTGSCRVCRKEIKPGDKIVFRGRGNSAHEKCHKDITELLEHLSGDAMVAAYRAGMI